MNSTSQRACAWAGIASVVIFLIALWPVAGFFPPMAPGLSAEAIAQLYRDHALAIRIATVLTLISGACFAAFTAGIAAQMRRMETRETPVLTYVQLCSGAVVTIFFVAVAVSWSVAAFRPERNPELTQALNDLAWFWFLFTATVPALQNFALGCAILGDRAPVPVMPRWVGFVNIWIATVFLPGLLITFFKSGPFAWNGLFGFWIPAGTFVLWFFVVAAQLLKAIARQEAESR